MTWLYLILKMLCKVVVLKFSMLKMFSNLRVGPFSSAFTLGRLCQAVMVLCLSVWPLTNSFWLFQVLLKHFCRFENTPVVFPREQPWFLYGWEASCVVAHLLSWLRPYGNDFWVHPAALHPLSLLSVLLLRLSMFDFFSFSIFPVHLRSYTLFLQKPVSILHCIAVCKALQTSVRITVCLVSFSRLWVLESI